MRDKLVVVVPCELRFRDPVGALIQQVCRQLPGRSADQTLGFQVVSAFNEAFNNLCQYAYPDCRGEIEVRIEILDEALVIEICDEGETYDYEEVSVPDLTDVPESGLGIFIIRSFMSEVAYSPGESAGAKNVLRMVRQLQTPT